MTREEVVKWLESLKRETGKAENRSLWHYAESIDMAIKALSPEVRPTGEWIMKHDGVIFKRTWGVCSRCGNTLDFDGLNAGRGDANFCPNCGARMLGEDGEAR